MGHPRLTTDMLHVYTALEGGHLLPAYTEGVKITPILYKCTYKTFTCRTSQRERVLTDESARTQKKNNIRRVPRWSRTDKQSCWRQQQSLFDISLSFSLRCLSWPIFNRDLLLICLRFKALSGRSVETPARPCINSYMQSHTHRLQTLLKGMKCSNSSDVS